MFSAQSTFFMSTLGNKVFNFTFLFSFFFLILREESETQRHKAEEKSIWYATKLPFMWGVFIFISRKAIFQRDNWERILDFDTLTWSQLGNVVDASLFASLCYTLCHGDERFGHAENFRREVFLNSFAYHD